MPKRLIIHALFNYTDPQTKLRATAYRGDTINVSGKDLERGTKGGAFGTAADLVPKALDEGTVDLAADEPTGTPIVPLVSRSAILETVLRERLSLPADATEADVVAALDAAMAKAKEEDPGTAEPVETPAPPSPPAPVGPVIVNLPDTVEEETSGGTMPPHEADPDSVPAVISDGGEIVEHEGQAVVTEQTPTVEPPPQSALKARWEAHAVAMGMTEGEAKAASKQDLIAKYGGS
jgi:hypothetical protein